MNFYTIYLLLIRHLPLDYLPPKSPSMCKTKFQELNF